MLIGFIFRSTGALFITDHHFLLMCPVRSIYLHAFCRFSISSVSASSSEAICCVGVQQDVSKPYHLNSFGAKLVWGGALLYY